MLIFAAAALLSTDPAVARQHAFTGLTLAPAGDQVASVEYDESLDQVQQPHKTVVLRRGVDGAVLRSLDPCPGCAYADPAFSPDGQSLAFLGADPSDGSVSLYVATAKAVTLRATFKGVAERPRWSPDGHSLAFLAVVGAHKEVGATQAAAPQVGEIGESFDEKRIAVLPAQGSEPMRLVSPADSFVYEYDWTPDGTGFVATMTKGDGDNNWWTADLEAVDLATGAARRIAKPVDQLNAPRVSPDGRQVAYIGGLMSDFGSVGGDVYLVPTAGGAPVDITPGYKGSFTNLAWRKGRLIATAIVSDKTALVEINPATGDTRTLNAAPVTLTAGEGEVSVSLDAAGDRAAAVVQDFGHAPEITVAPLAYLGLNSRVTKDNQALAAAGMARSVEWTSEGHTVQGWLLSPLSVEPGKTYPMVVNIHGGPSAADTSMFLRQSAHDRVLRRMLGKGYFVFLPNPRGSYGQGEAFTRANIRDFGGGDLRDILAGVDAVEKIAPVDDKRLAVYGHSYGGFMTMWAVTHTNRFHAAIAGAGIANWISYYGENGIDQWMIPFFGASAYDEPAIYRALSPLDSIKAAKTPTFIYVGEHDVECPAPQSIEFWHALKAMGVPTKLLILEGEGHAIRKPEHNMQLSDAEMEWLDRYLGVK